MDNVLSQEEIDALLQAVKDGSVESGNADAASRKDLKVAPYSFRRPHSIPDMHMRCFRAVHEDLAERIGYHSLVELKTAIDVKLISCEIRTSEETMAAVGQSLIIPLNPDAMFYKIGKQKALGERLSREYDVEYQGKSYRAQIFEKGIVYAEVGDWGNVKVIPRTN